MSHYSEQIERETGYQVTSLSTHNSLVAENAKLRLIVEKLNRNPEYKIKALEDQLKAKDAEIKELKSYYASATRLAYRYKDKLDKYGLGDR